MVWPEGHKHEKTEKRNPEENLRIGIIAERLKQLEQVELVNDDSITPMKLELYWNRQHLVVQIFISSFTLLLGFAGIINDGKDLIHWLVLAIGVVYFYVIRKSLPYLFHRGVALTIDKERIVSVVPSEKLILWADIDSVYFAPAAEELVIEERETDGKVCRTMFNLDFYGIRDKALFKRQVKVFADRHKLDMIG